MATPTLQDPPAAALERRRVGARPMAEGVLGSHGASAGRPVFSQGRFQLPGQVRDMMHA